MRLFSLVLILGILFMGCEPLGVAKACKNMPQEKEKAVLSGMVCISFTH